MGRFNRFPPKGIFLPSILDIYSKMKILLEAVPWLKQPNHQSWASSCWELYTSKVRDAVGEYILLFSITTTAAAAAADSPCMASWLAGEKHSPIFVFFFFPYNNIPLASPAIWFCSMLLAASSQRNSIHAAAGWCRCYVQTTNAAEIVGTPHYHYYF